jgi:hypothetical protein
MPMGAMTVTRLKLPWLLVLLCAASIGFIAIKEIVDPMRIIDLKIDEVRLPRVWRRMSTRRRQTRVRRVGACGVVWRHVPRRQQGFTIFELPSLGGMLVGVFVGGSYGFAHFGAVGAIAAVVVGGCVGLLF